MTTRELAERVIGGVGGTGVEMASLHTEMLTADHAARPREAALGAVGMCSAAAAGVGMVDPTHVEVGTEQVPMRNLIGRDDPSNAAPSTSTSPSIWASRVSAVIASRSLCTRMNASPTRAHRRRSPSSVLHVPIPRKLHRRQALRGVREQADRAEQIDERRFARREDGAGGRAELAMTCRAFEPAARRQVADIEASADGTYERAIRLRPPQAAEPPKCRVLAFGADRLQRKSSCNRPEQEVLPHSAGSHDVPRKRLRQAFW